jgi:hypothetical protein
MKNKECKSKIFNFVAQKCLPAHNEPVEKPAQNTAFPLRLFCLLFVINFAGFW